MTGLVALVASYHSFMLKFAEPLITTDSFTNADACLVSRFHTPVAMEAIGTPDSGCLEG